MSTTEITFSSKIYQRPTCHKNPQHLYNNIPHICPLVNGISKPAAEQYIKEQDMNSFWVISGSLLTANSVCSPCNTLVYLLLRHSPAISPGFTILGEIFAYVSIFNPTIEIVTLCLPGWCMLGVFLLPAFTRLGHECQDLSSPCDGMRVFTDQTSVYTLIQKSFGGMESDPC